MPMKLSWNECFARFFGKFHSLDEPLTHATAMQLFGDTLVAIGHTPTDGELVDYLRPLHAEFVRLYKAVGVHDHTVFVREWHKFIHLFVTPERLQLLPVDVQSVVNRVLAMPIYEISLRFSTITGRTPQQMIDAALLESVPDSANTTITEDIAAIKFYRELRMNYRVWYELVYVPSARRHLSDLLSGISVPDEFRKEFLAVTKDGKSHQNPYEPRLVITEWKDACEKLVQLLELPIEKSKADLDGDMFRDIAYIRHWLNGNVGTNAEREASRYVLGNDRMFDLRSKRFSVVETAFLVLEAAGVSTETRIVRVIRRLGFYGVAKFCLAPSTHHGVFVCLIEFEQMRSANCIQLLRGSFDEVLSWVMQHHNGLDFEDHKNPIDITSETDPHFLSLLAHKSDINIHLALREEFMRYISGSATSNEV